MHTKIGKSSKFIYLIVSVGNDCTCFLGYLTGTVNFPELLLLFFNIDNIGVKIFFVISEFSDQLIAIVREKYTGSID